ncbi:MAG: right-handed parallel beta-helix repeat-containing protein [Mycobacteriales bacterium]
MSTKLTCRRAIALTGISIGALTGISIGLLSAPVVTGTGAATAQAVGGSVVVPSSIDSTGQADVTAKLNAFFASVPDGSTVVLKAAGTYRIEGTVVIAEKNNLILDGNGAKTITETIGDRSRQHIRLVRGSNIIIRDLTIKGANPYAGTSDAAYVSRLEAQHGINVAGTRGLELDRVTVTDVYGDFIYLGKAGDAWSEDVRIHDSTFARNGRQGLAITAARRVRFDHNTIQDTRRATFDLEPNGAGWGVEDVLIDNNVVGSGRLNFLSAVGRGPVNRVKIQNNVLKGKSMNGTVGNSLDRRSDWIVSGNTSDRSYGNPGGRVMTFQRVNGVVFTDNTQPVDLRREMVGTNLYDVCGFTVESNTMRNSVGQSRVITPCANG